jgi:hypothetical protein
MCKKRKYETEDPDITLTEDDAELIMEKVQDRGEEVVELQKCSGKKSWPSC